MTQKLDSSKKSGEEILQTIEPKGIADESMRRTVEILLNLIEQLQAEVKELRAENQRTGVNPESIYIRLARDFPNTNKMENRTQIITARNCVH